jgi:hypothetical protein
MYCTNLDKLAGTAGNHVGAALLAEQGAHHVHHAVQVGLLLRVSVPPHPLHFRQEPVHHKNSSKPVLRIRDVYSGS